ncbi:MerR family transcriptional regulator [Paenibacillus psychroresistens]|uniref:MerR family transcriptional regulator n=1 Tax=Paenibacillus psychroresistens TaxID=1778678 RepID=A0A6B8RPB4_9BACL|nr:MerR family transcriptional regulator [Paenibacillus psychroresistens]QGQ97343.1 MerR family transcriptional regulator [Paenibacillus psychroresistens]
MENKFSSKQVSEETRLSIHTLRYYEKIGLIYGIERDENGYRQYSESDIAWFQALSYFRAMGMPIREIQQFGALQNREDSAITARRKFMETYRGKVIDQINELEKTLGKIDHKINFFKNLETSDKLQQDR